jgi:hypothetical protein
LRPLAGPHGWLALACALALVSCARGPAPLSDFSTTAAFGERARVLRLYPGVTATIVAPAQLDASKRIDLILYALPNGNTTAETMGRRAGKGVGWRYDIQHIAAQTRALRARGYEQAVVAYLEADTRSWPGWRSRLGYERANRRIVDIVDQIRNTLGASANVVVTLTGHSGGGSFAWGFIDGQAALPSWLERIAFLDSNYSFEPRHGSKIGEWLARAARNTLVVLAYDDREIMLDGKKVVSDSGGTWRASQRMIAQLAPAFPLAEARLGEFIRYHHPQIEILLHPNPDNKILHTVMIGELNGYMHALLVRRDGYTQDAGVLRAERAYTALVGDSVRLPAATTPAIPQRARAALTGRAFIAAVATLPREEREAAIRRELLAGNIPAFLRALRTVTVTDTAADGTRHTLTYQVMPDYLAIGSDEDFVRMPMNPYTAQSFADAFGFALLTRKMSNDIWRAAEVKLDPMPLTEARDSAPTFLLHHRIIERQLAEQPRGVFVAGHKKDVVVTNRLQERAQRVAIYGWHYPDGKPIQPLYNGHVDWYVDYSHGIRPVLRRMKVDGMEQSFEQILSDANLSALLSDEGVIAAPHY